MFRKNSPIHKCKWRQNGPKFVLPFYCALQIGGIFLCSKHQRHLKVAKCLEKVSLSTGAQNSNGDLMAPNLCYISIVHCRQKEFFYAQNTRDTFRWQNVQKQFPYPQVLNIQTTTKWQQICFTFLLCILDRRNFSVLKTLGTLLGIKMVRKSSPIHRCLKFKRRPNGPKFV